MPKPRNIPKQELEAIKLSVEIARLVALDDWLGAFRDYRRAARDPSIPNVPPRSKAGLIAPVSSENQTEAEDAKSADDDGDDEDKYPWEDVDRARHNRRLQRKHPPGEADKYRATAKPCPKCGKASADLAWFYFESPKWTWENLCGRAGWMTVCDPCGVQVDFFLEVLN